MLCHRAGGFAKLCCGQRLFAASLGRVLRFPPATAFYVARASAPNQNSWDAPAWRTWYLHERKAFKPKAEAVSTKIAMSTHTSWSHTFWLSGRPRVSHFNTRGHARIVHENRLVEQTCLAWLIQHGRVNEDAPHPGRLGGGHVAMRDPLVDAQFAHLARA